MNFLKRIAFRLFGRFVFMAKAKKFLKDSGIKGEDVVGRLKGYRTFITAGLAVLSAIAAALVGDADLSEALNRVWQALTPLSVVFLRAA